MWLAVLVLVISSSLQDHMVQMPEVIVTELQISRYPWVDQRIKSASICKCALPGVYNKYVQSDC